MRTIFHLSDLHFGRIEPATLEPLVTAARKVAPDVVVISGDLTQRARSAQFVEARAFLERLPGKRVVVPGNHDVPLYNVVARIARPFEKYRRYIDDDLEPFFADDEIAVAGMNTAHGWTVKGGLVRRSQIVRLRDRLCGLPRDVTRMVVTHHPLDLPETYDSRELARRAREAMEALVACDADVLLSGHLHASHSGGATERHHIRGHVALCVHAGTATSTRGRGEPNSFNVLRVNRSRIDVLRYAWAPEEAAFLVAESKAFVHAASGWSPAPPGDPAPALPA
jgi:3',5'-cyclic AMP phosphodiesterase CpdA